MGQVTVISGAVFGSFELGYYNTLGSSEECIIVIKDPSVLPTHAVIERQENTYQISKGAPEADVLVNSARISVPTNILNGDMIQLGRVSLLFNCETQDAPSDVLKALTPPPEEAGMLKARVKPLKDAKSIVDTLGAKEALESKIETLFRVASLMNSTLNFDQIKSNLFEIMFEIFKPDRIFLLLFDERGKLRVNDRRIAKHCELKGFEQVSRSLIKEAVEKREALLSKSAVEDKRFNLAESVISQNIQSVMCTPLISKDRVIGALYMDRLTQRRMFSEEDLNLLNAIASQVAVTVENVTMYDRNRDFSQKLISLSKATRQISNLLDEQKIMKTAVEHAIAIFNCAKCSVLLYNEVTGNLEVAWSNSIDPLLWPTIKIKPGEGYCGKVFVENRPLLCSEIAKRDQKYESDSFLICPIVTREEIEALSKPRGVIAVTDKITKKPFDRYDQELLIIFASALGVAINNSRLFQKATVDSLTKTLTRQFFFVLFEEKIKKHKQLNKPIALLMIDIDSFKKINDELGHQAGDLVLSSVSRIIKSIESDESFVGRYGGDEFVLAVPFLNSQDSVAYAEEIRRTIERQSFTLGQTKFKVTLSIGITGLTVADTSESLIKKADMALYTAKKHGRNRVEFYSEPTSTL